MPTRTKNITWKQKSKAACAPGSFRTKRTRTGKLLRFCCPKGYWHPTTGRCAVGVKLEAVGLKRKRR